MHSDYGTDCIYIYTRSNCLLKKKVCCGILILLTINFAFFRSGLTSCIYEFFEHQSNQQHLLRREKKQSGCSIIWNDSLSLAPN